MGSALVDEQTPDATRYWLAVGDSVTLDSCKFLVGYVVDIEGRR